MRLFALLSLLAATGWAEGIVTRHDSDPAAHRELARRFPSLVHLNLPDGEAVLIRPGWVLTAAHVAVEVEPGHSLTVGGRDAEAAEVFVHPAWNDGPHDIALIRLRSAATSTDPSPVYRDRDEQGKLIYLVGRGYGGTGLTGPDGVLGELRGATNRIDEASDNWLKFGFDDPREEGSGATELEGISGPGDSGGPAYVEIDGVHFVVGVSSGQSTGATGGVEGVYGVTEFYTRVSSYFDWIDATIAGARP